MRRTRTIRKKSNEKGMAFVVAIFALMLISAVAFGMMYMSSTDTNINANYRAEQLAYFASEAGLQEGRERLGWSAQYAQSAFTYGNNGQYYLQDTSNNVVLAPKVLPTLTNGGIIYITNPNASDGTVQPWNPNDPNHTSNPNPYYDDELCHEGYAGLSLTDSGIGTRCPTSALPSGTQWYTVVPSIDPNRGTVTAMPYKWVRIAVKNNRSANPYFVDQTGTSTNVVCWDDSLGEEDLLAKRGKPAVKPVSEAAPQLAQQKRNWFQRMFDDVFGPSEVSAYYGNSHKNST